ncbi:MAG TPA: site-specific integrase [Myxococcota bacterium]|nr:site-specific integrase [Myxococcota bacterium]
MRTAAGEEEGFGRVRPREKGREGYRIDLHPLNAPRFLYTVSGQTFATADQARFVLDGIRYEINVLKKAPEDAVARFLSAKAKPNLVPARYQEWIAGLEKTVGTPHGIAERTLAEYRRYGAAVASRFAAVGVREVTEGMLESWSVALAERETKISPKTRRNIVSAFRTFLGWCKRHGHAASVPDLPRIRQTGKRFKAPKLSAEEQNEVLLEIDESALGIFLAMALLGLRAGEARAVQVEDVDLSRELMVVCRAVKGLGREAALGPTKTGEERELPLPSPLSKWLRERMPSEGFVFLNPKTQAPWTHWSVRQTWIEAAKAAGIPEKRIHLQGNTRHSCATAALQRGSDPRLVQALLGHASFNTTKRHYVEIGAEPLRGVVER